MRCNGQYSVKMSAQARSIPRNATGGNTFMANTLVQTWKRLLQFDLQPWVAFENGTCVLLTQPDPDIEAQAKAVLAASRSSKAEQAPCEMRHEPDGNARMGGHGIESDHLGIRQLRRSRGPGHGEGRSGPPRPGEDRERRGNTQDHSRRSTTAISYAANAILDRSQPGCVQAVRHQRHQPRRRTRQVSDADAPQAVVPLVTLRSKTNNQNSSKW